MLSLVVRRAGAAVRRAEAGARVRLLISAATVGVLAASLAVAATAESPTDTDPWASLVVTVTSVDDSGEGTLRSAVALASATDDEVRIAFDPGVFGRPRDIVLESTLTILRGHVVIDGYIEGKLWTASGATLSGPAQGPALHVGQAARVTIRHLTVADACGDAGSGVLNEGDLVVDGVTFRDNASSTDGGAILNLGGALHVVNSTFFGNRAEARGGGVASLGGAVRITNCTFTGNDAGEAGGLYSDGFLDLANSILAGNGEGLDCVSAPAVDGSAANLVLDGDSCGPSVSRKDPRLERPGYYNGPTQTIPLGAGSPAINRGDNAAAVDELGRPLVWDQRGNGDPRFVAGYTDLGAFEHQRFPHLVVDTPDDSGLRACTAAAVGDCSLRGAIELANATPERDVVSFDPRALGEQPRLELADPLPRVTAPLAVDATDVGGAELVIQAGDPGLHADPDVELTVLGIDIARRGDAAADLRSEPQVPES